MKIRYASQKLGTNKLTLIKIANAILAEYSSQGYQLTLRQLYYQFVARDHLPNNMKSYKTLGAAVNEGRMNGLIDWNHIVDRTRGVRGLATWKDPQHRLSSVPNGYSIDKWDRQPTRPEVWVEKDALVGIIEQSCAPHQVDFLSCRGYTSQSEMWAAAQRLGKYMRTGQKVHIIHLGDHDPSGIDMSRDIEERIRLFVEKDNGTKAVDYHRKRMEELLRSHGVSKMTELKLVSPEDHKTMVDSVVATATGYGQFTFERIALNMDQIEQQSPPPNPAKLTDSRAKGYIDEHGYESWELDALSPNYMTGIIEDAINDVRDNQLWDEDLARETADRNMLQQVTDNWKDVSEYLRSRRSGPEVQRGRVGPSQS